MVSYGNVLDDSCPESVILPLASSPRKCFIADDCSFDLFGVKQGIEYVMRRISDGNFFAQAS
jgi:hypothetical protein